MSIIFWNLDEKLRCSEPTVCLLSSDVLIGAPRANTSSDGIVERGAVFSCPWRSAACQKIEFDSSGKKKGKNFYHPDPDPDPDQFFRKEPDVGADAAEADDVTQTWSTLSVNGWVLARFLCLWSC